ncbi:hypothetical protein FB567DRAFT_156300 [Paraphoma chrysanthemicola]|uniref:Uncharacterized protein n=1 Tax=Paraphoma chrysanthemicola TaxID=798071 RepID=A0A8K0VU76_9PLEO|nr:hypothetical protein FB567DRAFT_156300 [Paraphoma chrysanthemicola]
MEEFVSLAEDFLMSRFKQNESIADVRERFAAMERVDAEVTRLGGLDELMKQGAATKVLEMRDTEVEHLGGLEIVREHDSEIAKLKAQMAELDKAVRSIERKLATGEVTPSQETPLQLISQEPTPPTSKASRKRSGDVFATMPPPKRRSAASRASSRHPASASVGSDRRSSSGLEISSQRESSLQGSARTGPEESSPWGMEDPKEYPIAVLVPGQHGGDDNILYDGAVPSELSSMLRSEMQHHLNAESRIRVWNKLMPSDEKCVLIHCIAKKDPSTWPAGHVASRACCQCTKSTGSRKGEIRPCAVLRKDSMGTIHLLFLPLMEDARPGKTCEEKGFWIRERE